MKLTITVTDEQGATTTTSSEVAASAPAIASPNGKTEIDAAMPEIFDGGAVPDELLALEAQVAAGLKEVPGIQL